MMERKKQSRDAISLQVLSETLNRAVLSAKLGKSYDNERDVYKALGYKTELIFDDYATQYSRQDIAQAIINRPANATWKGALQLMESTEADETEFERAWIALEEKLSLKTKFKRLDKLTCLGSYAVLLLGFDDISNSEGFSTPMTKTKPKLLYVRPLSEKNAVISKFVQDPKNPRYGLPELYDITLTEASGFGAVSNTVVLKVHYSRVLHTVNDQMESEVYGEPVLKSVFNRLTDLEKLIGGSAEMFWRGARPGYQAKVDKDYQMTPATESGLKDQLSEFENNLRRVLVNEGVDMTTLDSQISDPKSHVDVQIQMISAITGIPKRILTGSERGELSSSQDEDTWLGLIQTRRDDFAEPKIVAPFVNLCISLGMLPKPKVGWSVVWNDLFAKSEKDMAEVGRIRATALREYTLNPVAVEVVPQQAFFEFFLGLTQHQINLITEMQSGAMNDEGLLQAIETQIALKKPPTTPKPVGA